ncbi:MAG: hypothetical protein WHV66_04595 [Anaerolineales bacterium]
MNSTIIILVNGEVLANNQKTTIQDQRNNAKLLAESLVPLFLSNYKIVVMHGNKPQVGFVLFRAELASHVLHNIPLDVCGADTQGATGYLLSQAFMNVLKKKDIRRDVACLITQTVVNNSLPVDTVPLKAIGPRFDREKAETYRQTRGWDIIEEPGRGYRRAVPSYPVQEVLGVGQIKKLADSGDIVIAFGGGGIPVALNEEGELEGIESVIDTDQVACLVGKQLEAKVMLMVVESDEEFSRDGIPISSLQCLDFRQLESIIDNSYMQSKHVLNKLRSAVQFLKNGGEKVVITTLANLPDTLQGRSGLYICNDVNGPITII